MNTTFWQYLKALMFLAGVAFILACLASYIASTIIRDVQPKTSVTQTR